MQQSSTTPSCSSCGEICARLIGLKTAKEPEAIRILHAPHPPPKQPYRTGPATARCIAERTLSYAKQGKRSPVELVMVKLRVSISALFLFRKGIGYVDDEIFLTADHLAFADLDEDIPRFKMELLCRSVDMQQKTRIDAGVSEHQ